MKMRQKHMPWGKLTTFACDGWSFWRFMLLRIAPPSETRLYFLSGQAGEEADPLYLRAITIIETALGPDHPSLASSLAGRAIGLQAQVCEFFTGDICRELHEIL